MTLRQRALSVILWPVVAVAVVVVIVLARRDARRAGRAALALLVAALVLPACGAHARYNRLDRTPEVFVRLSVAPKTCARADRTAEVYVFATRVHLPPGPLRFVVNDGVYDALILADPTATLRLERVGLGAHNVTVSDDEGHASRLSFSVWECVR